MTRFIIFRAFFFLLPFIIFLIYRLSTRNARNWKQAWPITSLTVIALITGVGGWVALNLMQPDKERNVCHRPGVVGPDGKITRETYECEVDVDSVGVPRTDTPGGFAPATPSDVEPGGAGVPEIEREPGAPEPGEPVGSLEDTTPPPADPPEPEDG